VLSLSLRWLLLVAWLSLLPAIFFFWLVQAFVADGFMQCVG
jgi:hypothetical protein